MNTTEAQQLAAYLNELAQTAGGFTYDLRAGDLAEKGFSVALAGFEEVDYLYFAGNDRKRRSLDWEIFHYLRRHQALLEKEPYCLGGWVDGENLYLDVVQILPDYQAALVVARAHKQIAFYDLDHQITIYTR